MIGQYAKIARKDMCHDSSSRRIATQNGALHIARHQTKSAYRSQRRQERKNMEMKNTQIKINERLQSKKNARLTKTIGEDVHRRQKRQSLKDMETKATTTVKRQNRH